MNIFLLHSCPWKRDSCLVKDVAGDEGEVRRLGAQLKPSLGLALLSVDADFLPISAVEPEKK